MLRFTSDQISAISDLEFDRFIADQSQDSGGWLHSDQTALPVSKAGILCRGLREAATEYGMHNQAALACLCQLSHLLGPDLLSDPSLPWVQPILDDATIPDGIGRANVIYAHACAKLEAWFPLENGRDAALRRLLGGWMTHAPEEITELVLPVKYAELNADALAEFYAMSESLSDESAQISTSLRVGIDFLFGVGWLEHPAGRLAQADRPLSDAGVVDVLQRWSV